MRCSFLLLALFWGYFSSTEACARLRVDNRNLTESQVVEVCVEFTTPLPASGSVTLQTSSITATASNDYLPLNVRIPVEAGRTSDVCGRFSINGDNLLENTELLQVTVSSNDTALCPDPQLTTVTLQIIDNTGAMLRLVTTSTRPPEGNPGDAIGVSVCLELISNVFLARDLVVIVNTVGVTADSSDYQELVNASLSFPPDSERGTLECIIVRIIGDNIREGSETFRVELRPLNANDMVDTQSLDVIILDDGDTIEDCGELPDPLNGTVNEIPNTLENSTARYSCDLGFALQGTETRACLMTGMWSNSAPTCQIVDCGNLTSPSNGTIFFPSTIFQSVASYMCDPGHSLVGESSRTCDGNGMWSGTAPTCEENSATDSPASSSAITIGVSVSVGLVVLLLGMCFGISMVVFFATKKKGKRKELLHHDREQPKEIESQNATYYYVKTTELEDMHTSENDGYMKARIEDIHTKENKAYMKARINLEDMHTSANEAGYVITPVNHENIYTGELENARYARTTNFEDNTHENAIKDIHTSENEAYMKAKIDLEDIHTSENEAYMKAKIDLEDIHTSENEAYMKAKIDLEDIYTSENEAYAKAAVYHEDKYIGELENARYVKIAGDLEDVHTSDNAAYNIMKATENSIQTQENAAYEKRTIGHENIDTSENTAYGVTSDSTEYATILDNVYGSIPPAIVPGDEATEIIATEVNMAYEKPSTSIPLKQNLAYGTVQ